MSEESKGKLAQLEEIWEEDKDEKDNSSDFLYRSGPRDETLDYLKYNEDGESNL